MSDYGYKYKDDAAEIVEAADLRDGDMIDGTEVLDWLERIGDLAAGLEDWAQSEDQLWVVDEIEHESPSIVVIHTLNGGSWAVDPGLELSTDRPIEHAEEN